MKILFPVKQGTLTQDYASTGNLDGKTYLETFGTKSHAGWDIASFHGDDLLACEDLFCYKVWNFDFGSVSHGYGARFLSGELLDGTQREWLYWHTMSNVKVMEGQSCKQGDVIAYEGDSGDVYQNGVKVPDAQKGRPPYPGTHVHWAYRLVKKVKPPLGVYVLSNIDGTPYYDKQGFAYEILNYDNGNRGCLDPALLDIVHYNEWVIPQPVLQNLQIQVSWISKVVAAIIKFLENV